MVEVMAEDWFGWFGVQAVVRSAPGCKANKKLWLFFLLGCTGCNGNH